MSAGLIFDADEVVVEYICKKYSLTPIKYDQAVGIVEDGMLCGGILFHGWNGYNVELDYYGDRTVTLGIVRCLARISVSTFKVSRVTLLVGQRNRQLIRALQKLGFFLEGVQRRYYGDTDTRRNTGVRLVMFRERLEELCKFEQQVSSHAPQQQLQ